MHSGLHAVCMCKLVSYCMCSYRLLDSGLAQLLHISAILDILFQLNDKWLPTSHNDQQ